LAIWAGEWDALDADETPVITLLTTQDARAGIGLEASRLRIVTSIMPSPR
jgi:hypothetical protein